MLTVAAAQEVILQQTQPLPPETMPLTSAALGAVLAEDIVSDMDMPPHDKALMDGYAVRSADLPEGQGTLSVIEEITAGQTPTRPVLAGQASRIMTGAPLPDGADAVIPVERTQMLDDGRVRIADRPPRPEMNILRRGREMRRGEAILAAGSRLRPQEFGVLATVGRTAVQVVPAPRVNILSTGDEVVEASQTPGPAQIRNSNGPMLVAQATRAGGAGAFPGYRPRSTRQPASAGGRRSEGECADPFRRRLGGQAGPGAGCAAGSGRGSPFPPCGDETGQTALFWHTGSSRTGVAPHPGLWAARATRSVRSCASSCSSAPL